MKQKQEIITFKVDESLMKELRAMPNRSEFIRRAILQALENVCPLCGGAGVLSPEQQRHWERFAENHRVEECSSCHELHLVCAATPQRGGHGGKDA